jgi:hypothetical protein
MTRNSPGTRSRSVILRCGELLELLKSLWPSVSAGEYYSILPDTTHTRRIEDVSMVSIVTGGGGGWGSSEGTEFPIDSPGAAPRLIPEPSDKFLKGIALSVYQNSSDVGSNWTHFVKKNDYMGQADLKPAWEKSNDFWNRSVVFSCSELTHPHFLMHVMCFCMYACMFARMYACM